MQRWIAAISIISDLSRARDKAAAALEAAKPEKKGPVPLPDNQTYIDFLTAAVTALDSAIAIARKNLPQTEPMSEELPPINFGRRDLTNVL